jgi:hypothetical protein
MRRGIPILPTGQPCSRRHEVGGEQSCKGERGLRVACQSSLPRHRAGGDDGREIRECRFRRLPSARAEAVAEVVVPPRQGC